MLVRSRRGRVGHRRGCRHLVGEEECVEDDAYPLCRACHPTCFVCMSEPGWKITACPDGHAVCRACLMRHVEASSAYGRLTCPCGGPLDVRTDVPASVLEHWIDRRMPRPSPPVITSLVTHLCEASGTRMSALRRALCRLHGAALRCHCGGFVRSVSRRRRES